MFEDCLIESTRHIAKRRGLTTLFSISMQMFALMLLVIFPLLRTNVLSPQQMKLSAILPYINEPTTTGSHPPAGAADSGRTAPTIVQVTQPSVIPHIIDRSADSIGHPIDPVLPPCTTCGNPSGVFGSIGTTPLLLVVMAKPPKPFPISHLDPGQIILRVEPAYPALARTARIQGPVILHALISRDGTIEQLQVLSGHPMLNQAALDAVRQWRFRPYLLNGQTIEVETQITVNFVLGGS
ncbi:MAG TPA: energy transducer TonB [Terriglobales bacterium]|jgi:protein TonB|nr:energy transducer TonB [Terriglobales bacterium]